MFRNQGYIFRKTAVRTRCFTCIRVGSLAGTRVCPVQTAYTDAYRTHLTITVYTNVFLKMNPRVRNM